MGHFINWIFATPELATIGNPGLFYGGGLTQLGIQALGVFTSGLYAFVVSFVILAVMKKLLNGLRVTEEEEMIGLDLSEHGVYGYPEAFESNEQKLEANRKSVWMMYHLYAYL